MAHNIPELNIVSPKQNRSGRTLQINWNICILCQIDDGETLINPTKRKGNVGDDGYATLDSNLNKLSSLHSLPFTLDLSSIDNGSGIGNTLRNHSAKWHSTCYKKCSNREVVPAEKRFRTLYSSASPAKKKI